jgi:hypothetical protein
MEMVVVGTVQHSESAHDDAALAPYIVEVVEQLQGPLTTTGRQGQAVKLELDSNEKLTEGKWYRVTAQVECIVPMHASGDVLVLGKLLAAQPSD